LPDADQPIVTGSLKGVLVMNPLKSAWGTIITGIVLAVIVSVLTRGSVIDGTVGDEGIILWTHVGAGVLWIGLLYYFNFVQTQGIAAANAEKASGGPGPAAINKYIAPQALLLFRWAAVVTWLMGAAYLLRMGNFVNAFTLGTVPGNMSPEYGLTIGIGAWLGSIMLFNVWVLIWPNQKKILGIVQATPEQVASARVTALMTSRTNAMLSIPMLMSMVGPHHGFWF
jgi:uncharacterized membrane protein